ncbi:glycosyl hydrolase family 95 catalytic domain-containing protein [Paenibacillus sp. JDR-2]|uniref:glycosyl hydrolase family 95 catalytic domain-containing protein n=1 Tax=Paenibacillus sp. (strain JDR-2) TaxID=324057 RepID=UPI0001667A90|nr:glycoside hydrolase N-terminal domain-containing protein [Paenibacillus sp. JDR-2]ACT02284.1 Trehalose and maltose hydrolase (phosphorylase)-like protein [Paenibacillus sp. JDR-2]
MTTVTYDNTPSSWNEALPLGNGHFGGMVYYEDEMMTMALNHYEVYYRKLHRYSTAFQQGEGQHFRLQYGRTFDELRKHAQEMYRNPAEEPFFLYGDALSASSMYRKYGKPPRGSSHYPTGEIKLYPSAELKDPDHYELQLDVIKAEVRLRIEKEDKKLEVATITAEDGDFIVTDIRQTDGTLVSAIELTLPLRRYADIEASYHSHDDTTFYYIGSFYPDGEDKERHRPFSFVVMTKLLGAKGTAVNSTGVIRIRLDDAENNLTLLTTVVTEAQADDPLQTAFERLRQYVPGLSAARERHQSYWQNFWRRSSVTLPDKLLEDLYRINLYALSCSSGRGGTMPEQACGLNGLWDIKQPTKWGSMWYWDVNIQAAFWPLYTSNHLELASLFNEGLLSYAGSAERMAKQFYGLDGIAGDYPHALYYSIWPWCAQFLWDYYRYSMDETFLREKAYPPIRKIAKFFEGLLLFDAESGLYNVFPDISPEQGPLTRNSTCTLSSVNYLFRMAIEASELLGEPEEERSKWEDIAGKLAPYPEADSTRYGKIWLDSEWAPPDLALRHPSLLMPIYPIGEIDRNAELPLRQQAGNTLRYVEENTEFGMFQFGWLSCAASRLGKGDDALRLLYEQGIDLSLRCNGLFAEETERWMNYCNITNEPLYHPFMMEASGELVAAVNEMLLQSYDGVIEVFPAVPEGTLELERTNSMYNHQLEQRTYGKWEACAFRGLLAVGSFEVSARRKEGRTEWVHIRSLAGAKVVLRNPFDVEENIQVVNLSGSALTMEEYSVEQGDLVFNTVQNADYLVYVDLADGTLQSDWPLAHTGRIRNNNAISSPRVHEAHTRRRVFLGKNRDTEHYRLLDHFTFDYYAGNSRISRLAAYRLDFGVNEELLVKNYTEALPRQIHTAGVLGQAFRKVTPDMIFTPYSGIGWERTDQLTAIDRGASDLLRRDFVGGAGEAVFRIELPKGRYDLLIVTGDEAAPSCTELEIPGQLKWRPEKPLKAGEYATEMIPMTQKKDGCASLRFRSREGLPWRINLLVINRNYSYL